MSDGCEQGPMQDDVAIATAERSPEEQLREAISRNRYDSINRVLRMFLANGELADYDSELANRVRDAIDVITLVSRQHGVPLSLKEAGINA